MKEGEGNKERRKDSKKAKDIRLENKTGEKKKCTKGEVKAGRGGPAARSVSARCSGALARIGGSSGVEPRASAPPGLAVPER